MFNASEQLKLFFDQSYYLDKYADIKEANVDALQHFIEFGIQERRSPNPNFDPVWYEENYPESKLSKLSAFEHYLQIGEPRNYIGRALEVIDNREYFNAHLNDAIAIDQTEKVSVIMTVRAPPDNWLASVYSIFGQNYKNIELIVVIDDDKNLHKIRSNLNSISGTHLKTLHFGEIGRSAALNKGLEHVSGTWTCFLDADNWWDAHFISLMLCALKNKKAAIGYCGQLRLSPDKSRVLYKPFDRASLQAENFIDLNTLMFNRDKFKRFQFDENLTRLIDYDFVRLVAESGHDILSVPAVLSFYDDSYRPSRISNSFDFNLNKELIDSKYRTRLGRYIELKA